MRIKIIILFIFISLISLSQTNVYIDPTTDPTGDGSIGNPYDSWTDVSPLQSNTNYYIKAGTTSAPRNVSIRNVSNVLVSTYGGTEKARLIVPYGVATAFSILARDNASLDEVTIENFYIEGNNTGSSLAGIGIEAYNNGTIGDVYVRNCVIQYGYTGIRSWVWEPIGISPSKIYRIHLDCDTIYNQTNDNILFSGGYQINFQKIVIDSCYMYNANLEWFHSQNQADSDGDNIQIVNYDSVIISDGYYHRALTSNKFCIILSYGGINGVGGYAEFRNNTFYPPKDTTNPTGNGSAGSAIAVYSYIDKTIFEYNKTSCRGVWQFGAEAVTPAMFFQSDTVIFNYNVLDSTGFMAFDNTTYLEAWNNTIISQASSNEYLVNTANMNNGSWKNNIVLVPIGVSPFNGTNTLTKSNNINESSAYAGWDATYGFTNSLTGDYTLLSTSSLIDQADETYTGLRYDIKGDNVPYNTLVDIGAYEYIGEVTPDPPVANFSGYPTLLNAGNTVQFTDASTGGNIIGWNWIFEGGNPSTSTLQNPVVTYSNPGTFNVTLIVENDEGRQLSSPLIRLDYITVQRVNAPVEGAVLMDGTRILLYNGHPVQIKDN